MLKIVSHLFDLVFPPRPPEALIRQTSPEFIIGLANPRLFERTIYLLSYQHTVVTALMTENKFHRNETAAKLLATILTNWLDAEVPDAILVPIPLSRERRKSRGYNQVEEILKQLPAAWRARSRPELLLKVKHTEAQTSLKREQRLSNMQGAFVAQPNVLNLITPAVVIIIDDVVTTGATLKAAEASLRPHLPYATIILLGLAH